jgi:hypothetical protein
MNPIEVTFHVEVTHSPSKTQSKGKAKKIIGFVPVPGLKLGERELLTVGQVHWMGYNTFDVFFEWISQPARTNLEYFDYADLQAMKDDVAGAFKYLDWEWRDETTG